MFPKPNQERAKIAIMLLYMITGIHCLSIILSIAGGMVDGDSFTAARTMAPMLLIIGGLNIVVYIVCVVVFMQWFRRAYNNLHLVGSRNLSFSEGWASGAWFVPILNLGRPYKIMREIWDETQTIGRMPHEVSETKSNALVGWWWAAWLSGNIIGNISFRMQMGTIPVDREVSLVFDLLSDGLSITAGLLLIQIIRTVSAWEIDMLQRYMNYEATVQQQQYQLQQQYQQQQPYQQQGQQTPPQQPPGNMPPPAF